MKGILESDLQKIAVTGGPAKKRMVWELTSMKIRTQATFPSCLILQVVLQKSTPTEIRQLALYYYQYDALVDGFVWSGSSHP